MGVEDLPSRIREFLRQRGAPASSLLLAERFLKILPGSEALGARLLDPILRPPGFRYVEDVGWSLPVEAGGPVAQGAEASADTIRSVACAVMLESPSKGRDRAIVEISLLPVGVAPAGAGEPEAPVGRETSNPRPIHSNRGSPPDWPAISAILQGAEAVFIDPRLEAPPLLAELTRRELPGPVGLRSLLATVRGATRIPRGSDVEAICHRLGAPHREGSTAADAASNVAACLERAAAIRALAARPGEGTAPFAPGPASRILTPAFLREVPERPGVYRFFDAAGSLTYVGKAANLRRRLATYAAHAARGTGGPADRREGARSTPALASLARIEYETIGSDLEALLREARLIQRKEPLDNVQRQVHERGRAYGASRSVALLLPSASGRSVSVLFVRDAVYEGLATLGPKGGGRKAMATIVGRLFGKAARGGRPLRADRARDTEILSSWLARHGDAVSRVDLDAAMDPEAAVRLLEAAAGACLMDGGEVTLHR